MKPHRALLIAAGVASLAFAGLVQADKPPKKPADDAAVRKALSRRLHTLELADVRFKEALQFLRDASGCKIEVDWGEVEQAKIKLALQTRVTLNVKNIGLAHALRQILDNAAGPRRLDFVVEEGRVLILPKAAADSRFISRLDADLKTVNAGAAETTALVKELLKARAGLPATRGRVAALERQLRQTAGPLLRQIDRKLVELGEVGVQLTLEGLGQTTLRFKAFSERFNVLAGALETIAGAGAWEPVPPAPTGKRRLLFRPDRTSKVKVGPKSSDGPAKPTGKWTAEKGKVVLRGGSIELTFRSYAPAAGDIELQTTLSFKGDKTSDIQIIQAFGPSGKEQRVLYSCAVYRCAKRGWSELVCNPSSPTGPKTPSASARLPVLKEGKAYPLRLLIRGRKLTCSLANRTVSVECRPLPARADLRYVGLTRSISGPAGDAVTLDDLKITCAAQGAPGKPKDAPKLAKKAAAEQERQAANLLKVADANRKIGLKRKAIEFYGKIVKEYPATAAAKEAKEWLTILRR